MDTIINTYRRLLSQTRTDFFRYLYYQINWDNRLIIIKGPKGVGKTTMMLQRIKESFDDYDKALYVSVDNVWFATHSIVEFTERAWQSGCTTLFFDEVHKYPNWSQEIKNVYDSYPGMKFVVTGSSLLELQKSLKGDLSRRARRYDMAGMSFREYLNYKTGSNFCTYKIEEILSRHTQITAAICQDLRIMPLYKEYLRSGYYPFSEEEGDGFNSRLQSTVMAILETEIPAVANLRFSSVYKLKRLLSLLAQTTPFLINSTDLSKNLSTSRDIVLKLLQLLDEAQLTRSVYTADNIKLLAKPDKLLFDNTNLMYALSENIDIGTCRETFFANQISAVQMKLWMPEQGDFKVNDKWLFEVGGRKKGFKQIKDIPDSYVVADDLEIGFGNKLPIWLFGFLY